MKGIGSKTCGFENAGFNCICKCPVWSDYKGTAVQPVQTKRLEIRLCPAAGTDVHVHPVGY